MLLTRGSILMSQKRIRPQKGQESVWDYPRPPKLEKTTQHLRVVFNGEIIAETNRAYRMLETSHPPTYYIPKADFKDGVLQRGSGSSFCEFKGQASYYDIKMGEKVATRAAWGYDNPSKSYPELKGSVSIYAHKMDSCFVNDEEVQAQEGDFYGGWITKDIVGPFKGAPGTWGW